jgi:N-acetylmuramoyl-L-alanine amidase
MRFLRGVLLLILSSSCPAGQVDVNGVRMWQESDVTRLVFDLSGPAEHSLFPLEGPHRVVVDLRNARAESPLQVPAVDSSPLVGIRSAPRGQKDMRIVLDLKCKVRPKSFFLRPNREYGHRLVIDLAPAEASHTPALTVDQAIADQGLRELVIAIDAGHGGKDPGAIGHAGTREKDVVLKVAKTLKTLVGEEHGMRAVMIRNGDYFLSLRQRVNKARQHKADLFVSIHADAFHDRRAQGSSVYVLSQRGASSEAARWLAERENAADLVGGVSLSDKDDLLASVLLDLSQTATIEASLEVGTQVLTGLRKIGKVHKRSVEQAGFVVLKSPDIPSILVETGFISNLAEERKLRSARHRRKLAQAILHGIHDYFTAYPPPGTLYASDFRHVIKRGDTLSQIASHYRVPLEDLRRTNGLTNDTIKIGQELIIPGIEGS